MNIIIYTKPGCKYCTQVKELMRRADLIYEERNITTPDQQIKFYNDYPDAKSYPHVIIDEEVIGGLVETAKLFIEKGLVSSR